MKPLTVLQALSTLGTRIAQTLESAQHGEAEITSLRVVTRLCEQYGDGEQSMQAIDDLTEALTKALR